MIVVKIRRTISNCCWLVSVSRCDKIIVLIFGVVYVFWDIKIGGSMYLYRIKTGIEGIMDARKALQEAILNNASLQRIEELSLILATAYSMIPVSDLTRLVEEVETKEAA